MFSLIITIIAIALVAALAVSSIYYGGNSFQKGTNEANAARYMNEGNQISAAINMYFLDNGVYPAQPSDLTDGGLYLKYIPEGDWQFQNDQIVRTGLSLEECQLVNKNAGVTTWETVQQCTDPLAPNTMCCETPDP